MSWLTKVGQTNSKALTTPVDVQATSHVRGQINHVTWRSVGSHIDEFVHHAWSNPDTRSPVAAVHIHYYHASRGRPRIDIDLVPRAQGFSLQSGEARLNAALDACGLRTNISQSLEEGETPQKLQQIGLTYLPKSAPEVLSSFWAIGRNGLQDDDEKGKAHITDEVRKVMEIFRDSNLLSHNPAIRSAIVEAIGRDIKQVRAISESTLQIER